MAIGSFGEFVFEVNSDVVKTFDNFSLESESRWAEHDMINVKKRAEFLSDGDKKGSLDILLSAELGVNPVEERDLIYNLKATGAVEYLIIGTKIFGKFYIKSISEEYKSIDGVGAIWEIKLKVTLNEYCEDSYVETKSTNSKITTNSSTVTKQLNYDTGKVS